MRRLISLTSALAISIACFGQGKQNVVQTGMVDAHGASWIPPTTTFAAPPPSPTPGSVYIFTDASAVGTCSGGGGALANCRWNGSAWSPVSGGPVGGSGTPGGSSGQAQINSGGTFAGQASIFSGGTLVQRAVECASGTVSSTALTAAAANQEITIQSAVSGNIRWDQVTVSETTQFAGTTGLTVSMGRPGTNNLELTGILVPLMVSSGDANYWTARPTPAQLTGTYPIVLNFAVTSGNVNAATAGTLTWEVCGYTVR
jgi:hypothetical protein